MGCRQESDFRFSYTSASGVHSSESARRMMQNECRVVAISSIFDMNMGPDVRKIQKDVDHRLVA